jgi:hypothetical protein
MMKALLFGHRQDPRVALATHVRVDAHDRIFEAESVQLGIGGMSLHNAGRLLLSQPVQLTFSLPSGTSITIAAVVRWKRNSLVGLRFDPRADTRQIQEWIESQQASQASHRNNATRQAPFPQQR